MVHMYQKYPEVILYDATYKLNNYQMPLFLQVCIDGNGETEIVSVYVCRSESREGIAAMINVFQEWNSNWQATKVIIGDKDFADRSIYSQMFPRAALQICLYHVLATFKKQITTQKMEISTTQRLHVLETLTKLVYSRTNELYEIFYQELCDTKLKNVLAYYNDNWHCIRQEWTLHGRNSHANYMNVTNNRTERLNRTFKQIGSRYANLLTFFSNITTTIAVLASEKDIKAVKGTMRLQRKRFDNPVLER